jgi:uncharacterized protein with GYD domain
MTTFIMMGRYTSQGVKEISFQRSRKGIEIVQQCGGKFLTGYILMGETDVLVVAEFPGINEAIKASVLLNRALGICFTTVPAISVEEFDKLVGIDA